MFKKQVPTHNLSEDQITEFKEAFSLFDKDGDGNITPGEFATLLIAIGYDAEKYEMESVVNDANNSGTGALDFTEFLVLMGRLLKRIDQNDLIANSFKVFDPENTGYISARQLMNVMSRLGEQVTDEEVAEMIKNADDDQDGRIGYDDFCRLMTEGNL